MEPSQIVQVVAHRECYMCKKTLPLGDFYYYPKYSRRDPTRLLPSSFQHACKRCSIEATARKRAIKRYDLKKFGISKEQYDAILVKQGGGCALCGKKPSRPQKKWGRGLLAVDHDHATGKVRGLLCNRCNLMLAASVADWHQKAYAYLLRPPASEVLAA